MLYYVSEEGRTVTITEGQCRVQPEALAGSPLEHGHIIQLDVTYDHSLLRADSVDGMLQAFYDVLEGELL